MNINSFLINRFICYLLKILVNRRRRRCSGYHIKEHDEDSGYKIDSPALRFAEGGQRIMVDRPAVFSGFVDFIFKIKDNQHCHEYAAPKDGEIGAGGGYLVAGYVQKQPFKILGDREVEHVFKEIDKIPDASGAYKQ